VDNNWGLYHGYPLFISHYVVKYLIIVIFSYAFF